MKHLFLLDPDVTFLNHGSFGACPRSVLEVQSSLREQLEREPVHFFNRLYEPLLDAARERLAAFVGARAEDLAVVPNATTGVNAVLRSLSLEPGDEVLLTSHGYNACTNAARFVAERAGARLVVAPVPFPLNSPEEVSEAVSSAVTPRTRLALVDHLTSPTAVVFPIADIVHRLEGRGVRVLVDGAHAPGQTPLHLDALGASYFAGNLHKWTCAPKGAAFLHVRPDRQAEVRPTTISHGANTVRPGRSRFRLEFDWQGTHDPTPFLSVPAALDAVAAMLPGGWDAVRAHGHDQVLRMRTVLLEAVGGRAPAPASMLGMMATLVLPPTGHAATAHPVGAGLHPLQDALWAQHRIEVPVFTFAGQTCLRVSAHLHTAVADAQKLAEALRALL